MNPAPSKYSSRAFSKARDSMYHMYLLKSQKNNSLYAGYTNDIDRRLKEHNAGFIGYTKKYLPWTLIYYESYVSLENAKRREKSLKHFGRVYSQLKKRIIASLKAIE